MSSNKDSSVESLIEQPTEYNGDPNFILSFLISEDLRQLFSLFLIVANFISLNCGITFIVLRWCVENSLAKQITFLQDSYQLKSVPAILLVSGIAIVLASLLGLKSAVGARKIANPEEAKSAAFYFLIYLMASGIVALLVIGMSFKLFGDIRAIRNSLERGLKDGVEGYSKGGILKEEIDLLQMDFSCCGVEGFKDWYRASWVDLKYLDKYDSGISSSLKNNKYFGQDVPFSCCKRNTIRPCVDTRIEDPTYHSMYNYPTDLTLNSSGCLEALTNFLGHIILLGIGLFAFFCFILWVAIIIITRYMHTSIKSMSMGKPPVGWLLPLQSKKKPKTSTKNYSKTIMEVETTDSASDENIYQQEDSD